MVCLGEDRFEIRNIPCTINWRPSLKCLLLPCTDNFVLPFTFLCPPFRFRDPSASENTALGMGYLPFIYQETEAVVSQNMQQVCAVVCQRVGFLLLLCSLALLPCLSYSSLSWFKLLKLSKSMPFFWIYFLPFSCVLSAHPEEWTGTFCMGLNCQSDWSGSLKNYFDTIRQHRAICQDAEQLPFSAWSHFCSDSAAKGDAQCSELPGVGMEGRQLYSYHLQGSQNEKHQQRWLFPL